MEAEGRIGGVIKTFQWKGEAWELSRHFTLMFRVVEGKVMGVVKTLHWVVARSRAQGKGLRGYQVRGFT